MKLKDDFFCVKTSCTTTTGFDYIIGLNPEHFIYKAHFPDNPITPGVCIVQITKELTEEILQFPLFLSMVKNIKFTQVINPLQYAEVTFVITNPQKNESGYKVSASVECENIVFAKMNLLFINKVK